MNGPTVAHQEAPTKHLRGRRLGLAVALLGIVVAVVLVLTGCAETARLVAKQSEAEAFLARAAAAMGTQPPTLKLGGVSNAASYASVQDGAINIRPEALDWDPARLHRILAHEFSHILLNNYRNGTTMAIEIDTDVKGVEVLMKADGLTEREAFTAFYDGHGGRTVMRGGTPSWPSRPGHGTACQELAAFVARFPEQATWAKTCPEG